ncbi:hypothetical protein [Micrococcus luteus]|uniref:hypothetical protein n=1 Tax=Micrococcus luteus TaxID=1270 RepID=UPI0036D1B868
MPAAADRQPPLCSTPGCHRPQRYRAAALCQDCYRRAQRRGRAGVDGPTTGRNSRSWRGDRITYAGAHERTIYRMGPADRYRCALCPGRAREWSLLAEAAAVHLSPAGLRYSTDPEDYTPLCVPCHRAADAARRAWAAAVAAEPSRLLPGMAAVPVVRPEPVPRLLIPWAGRDPAPLVTQALPVFAEVTR